MNTPSTAGVNGAPAVANVSAWSALMTLTVLQPFQLSEVIVSVSSGSQRIALRDVFINLCITLDVLLAGIVCLCGMTLHCPKEDSEQCPGQRQKSGQHGYLAGADAGG